MSADLIAHLQDLAADFGALSARRMFSALGVYRDGVMIGLISADVLYLKTDDQSRERFRAAGGEPFMYARRGETVPTSYWSVPEGAMDSPQEMRPWLRLGYEAALRKSAATGKRRVAKKAPRPVAKKAAAKKAAKKKAGVSDKLPRR